MALNSRNEFIRRTYKLLEQYDSFALDEHERYEITLRLNACVGLLLVGRQHMTSKIPDAKLESIGLSTESVITCKDNKGEDECVTTLAVSRHLRNAVAHARFDFGNEKNVIRTITFHDKRGRIETFNMTLSCKEFIVLTDWLFKVFGEQDRKTLTAI